MSESAAIFCTSDADLPEAQHADPQDGSEASGAYAG